MFAVRDRDERLVAREIGHVRGLPMRVDELRRRVVVEHIDGGPLLGAGAAENGEARAEGEPGAVRGREVLRDRLAAPARERLTHPVAELVALGVVEPPDVRPVRIEPARDPIAGALGAVGHLAMGTAAAVPRIDLETSVGVREIEEPIRVVAGPRRKSEPRRAVPSPPGCLRGDRSMHRTHHEQARERGW